MKGEPAEGTEWMVASVSGMKGRLRNEEEPAGVLLRDVCRGDADWKGRSWRPEGLGCALGKPWKGFPGENDDGHS